MADSQLKQYFLKSGSSLPHTKYFTIGGISGALKKKNLAGKKSIGSPAKVKCRKKVRKTRVKTQKATKSKTIKAGKRDIL